MAADAANQQLQTQNPPPQSPVTPPVVKKRFPRLVLIAMLVFILIVIACGIYYAKLQIKKTVPITQTKITNKKISPSLSPADQGSPSGNTNFISATPAPVSNKAEIGDDKTILLSPDKTKIATYYNSSPQMGEGTPTFTNVDTFDKTTGKTMTYKLSGPITYAAEKLFWSPVDNRVYFTNESNGVIIYAFWYVNPDGTNPKLISGEAELGDKNFQTLWNSSAMFAAISYDFSPDNKMIATIKNNSSTETQTIWVMNYDGTDSREIPIQGTYENLNKIAWESDEQHLLVTDWHGSYGTDYRISLSGGTPTKIGSQN